MAGGRLLLRWSDVPHPLDGGDAGGAHLADRDVGLGDGESRFSARRSFCRWRDWRRAAAPTSSPSPLVLGAVDSGDRWSFTLRPRRSRGRRDRRQRDLRGWDLGRRNWDCVFAELAVDDQVVGHLAQALAKSDLIVLDLHQRGVASCHRGVDQLIDTFVGPDAPECGHMVGFGGLCVPEPFDLAIKLGDRLLVPGFFCFRFLRLLCSVLLRRLGFRLRCLRLRLR
jgi:hypothetical protein